MKTPMYTFQDGNKYTAVVPVVYSHVNAPDPEYSRFSVTVALDPKDPATLKLLEDTLAFENEQRTKNGIPTALYPSNWLRKGQPRKDDKGNWLVPFVLDATKKDGTPNSVGVYDANGQKSDDIKVWGGDTVVVNFGVGVWVKGKECGTRYFLRNVQQVTQGERTGGGAPQFKSHATATAAAPVVESSTDEDDDIPF